VFIDSFISELAECQQQQQQHQQLLLQLSVHETDDD